jgi:pimeloyl-ACP methyl ester carboxylesterase
MATGSIPVLSKNYTFDPRPLLPFRIVAKRYWIEECPYAIDLDSSSKTREDVLTLVFVHGIGAHKELGEPMIQRLFQNQQAATRRIVRFHDIWLLDMPNQGDSAILNEETLRSGYDTCKFTFFHNQKHKFPVPSECMQSRGNTILEASMPS